MQKNQCRYAGSERTTIGVKSPPQKQEVRCKAHRRSRKSGVKPTAEAEKKPKTV